MTIFQQIIHLCNRFTKHHHAKLNQMPTLQLFFKQNFTKLS